jgi:hypothetical protein
MKILVIIMTLATWTVSAHAKEHYLSADARVAYDSYHQQSFDEKIQALTAAASQAMAKRGDQIASIDQHSAYYGSSLSFRFKSAKGYDCEVWKGWVSMSHCVMRMAYQVYCDQNRHVEKIFDSSPPVKECPKHEHYAPCNGIYSSNGGLTWLCH